MITRIAEMKELALRIFGRNMDGGIADHIIRRARPLFAGLMVVAGIGSIFATWADGLPGEYLLTSRWRAQQGIHSPLGNPAFLTEENNIDVRGVYSPTLQGAFQLWELGVTVPIGWYQSLGVTLLGENDGSVENAITDGTGRLAPGGTGSSNVSSFFIVSYAVNPWGRLSLGVNISGAYQTNYGNPIKGVGLDFGVSYRLARSPVWGDHLIGMSTINLIPPSMRVSTTPDLSSPSQYSRDMRLSWYGTFMQRTFDAGIDVDIKDFLAQAGEFRKADPGSSGELTNTAKSLEYDIGLRGGAWLLRLFRIAGQLGFGENASLFWGLAAGLNIPSVNMGRDLEVLYQYNSLDASQGISTHSIYARADLGSHREELYAKRVAMSMDASPSDLYNKALYLYHKGNYWDAFFIFGKILIQFPEFFKNDWVSYYMTSCQERLDMRATSRINYAKAIEAYPSSEMTPYAELGIMRVAYRDGDDAGVSQQFQKLITTGAIDSLRFHACYLMGESSMRQQEHAKAIQLFSIVPESHSMFIFAQQSMGVAYARIGNKQRALEAFDNAIRATPHTIVEQEAINRTLVLIGYLYYEESSLPKAVAALRRVPATSMHYEEALVGLGWAAVKAQQWSDCVVAAQELAKSAKDPQLQCEGLLLAAFALSRQEDFATSVATLRRAAERARKLSPPSQDSLDLKAQLYQSRRITYESVARRAGDFAMANQSSLALKMIDSLHIEQQYLKREVDGFLDYADLFKRQTLFARNLANLREDISYLLATVERMRATGKERGSAEKQRQLDLEIEKLKQEMKALDAGTKE